MDTVLLVFVAAMLGSFVYAFLAFRTPLGPMLRNPWAMLVGFAVTVGVTFWALQAWIMPALGW